MLGLIMIVSAVTIMVRVAEAENRSGILWGGITFILCFFVGPLLLPSFIGIFAGLLLSFGSMFALNLIQD